jgi:hypothetical protein
MAASLITGFIERKLREVMATGGRNGLLFAYWLMPRYALHGVAKAFCECSFEHPTRIANIKGHTVKPKDERSGDKAKSH